MGRTSTLPELFVVCGGQDVNIGDLVLRREYFNRLREFGHLHLLLGPVSPDFRDSLRLGESDVAYVGVRPWYLAAWRALFRGQVWFVDKPGELQFERPTLVRQLILLPLVLAIRARRGQVLRLGMALKAVNPGYLPVMKALFRLSTIVRWRDTSTGSVFGFGAAGPDWGFGWNKTAPQALAADRTDIVVTYRGDRDLPSTTIVDAIGAFARDQNRRIVVVNQVRGDAACSVALAASLDAELVPWPQDRSLAEHEDILRSIYRNSALVVSDRLHVLIVGMTEGAVPLCITDRGEAKVERHLDAVGFPGSAVSAADGSVRLGDVLAHQVGRRTEALTATRAALASLDGLTAQLAVHASARRARGAVH